MQTAVWVEGESVHAEDKDTCRLAYSCCRPELHAAKEKRKLFIMLYLEGGERTVGRMQL